MKAGLVINILAVSRNHLRISTLAMGDLNGVAAIRIHAPDLIRAVPVRGKENIASLRRDARRKIKEGVTGQLTLVTAIAVDCPEIAIVAGIDQAVIGREGNRARGNQ